MKHNNVKLSFWLLVFGITAHAQQVTTATGGVASGSGGNIDYSVGQIVYNTNTGTAVSLTQGVQQPYEISVVLSIANHSANLELTAFPNPTLNYLTLNVGKTELSALSFQLFDTNGRLIESRKIKSNIETIAMENIPAATYFLKISKNKNELKIFKIMKK